MLVHALLTIAAFLPPRPLLARHPAAPPALRAPLLSIVASERSTDLYVVTEDGSVEDAGRENAMYDTIGQAERPGLWASFEGRDKLTAAFLVHGMIVSAVNLAGAYTDAYSVYAVGVAAVLGLTSAAWGWFDLLTGRVSDDDRPGFAHERAIMRYTSSYLAGALWLSLRFSPLYPAAALAPLDPLLCLASIALYVYGLAAPLLTALLLRDELTPTEKLRMNGMIVSGAVGAVFILEATALLLNGGQSWWEHVLALYPAQDVLEPSVTLFAAYAVEAGMLIHRAARRGVITFSQAVPFYGTVVLPALTLLPMAALFWWKRAEVSFWTFLFLGPSGGG